MLSQRLRTSDGPQLVIDLANAKGECVVEGQQMPCDDVPRYLHDTLKVPSNTYTAVRSSSEHPTFESMNSLITALNKGGYEKVIGSFELSSPARAK